MARYAFSLDKDGKPRRIGDILRLSKNAIAASENNHRRFIVFGDPAMRMAWAPYRVQVETINGEPVDSEDMPIFKARQQVEFSGKIVDNKGELATNFNGSIVSTLFGPEQSVTTHGYGKEGKQVSYEDRTNRLAINIDTVVGGKFKVRIIIPSEVNNEYDNYRPSLINMYAYDSRDSIEAKGANSDFFIYGYEDEQGYHVEDAEDHGAYWAADEHDATHANCLRFNLDNIHDLNYALKTNYYSVILVSPVPPTGLTVERMNVERMKVIRNGQVVIVHEGKAVNLLGQEIK